MEKTCSLSILGYLVIFEHNNEILLRCVQRLAISSLLEVKPDQCIEYSLKNHRKVPTEITVQLNIRLEYNLEVNAPESK